MLDLSAEMVNRMVRLSAQESPREACGLLVGTGKTVTGCWYVTNISPANDRFVMDPTEQLQAWQKMEYRGLSLLGVWHSHVVTPATMSTIDIRNAYPEPGCAHVIVSLQPFQIRAYAITSGVATEVTVRLIND